MLAIIAPGQGAQSPGFLANWLKLPGAPERLGRWSEIAGIDLIHMGTAASAEEITDTAVAQPLLVAAALLAAEQLSGGSIAVGHSVGELAAGAIAGVLSPEDAIRLAGIRGRAMAAATQAAPTGMTAVLGGNHDAVLDAIADYGLTPANINARDQIVAAGTAAQLEAFAANPPPGVRLRPLRVAGAFHTAHMAPAIEALSAAAPSMAVHDPKIPVLSNRDGGVVTSGRDWLNRVIAQVAAPVRWDRCMDTLATLGVTVLLELPPAGVLTGLARHTLPGAQRIALKTPERLDAVRALADGIHSDLESHG
jgi:[acyl-carrier-protein] S-malonyltransferase